MTVGDGDSSSAVYWSAAKDGRGRAPSAEAECKARQMHAQARKRAEAFGHGDVHVHPDIYVCSTGETVITQYFGHEGICHPRTTIIPPEVEVREEAPCPSLQSGLADIWDSNNGLSPLKRFAARENPAVWNSTDYFNTSPNFLSKLPGRYSGLMRTVIQDMLGRNTTVTYNYRFSQTHGIYVSSLTGEHWVIEVTDGHVATWPIQKCTDDLQHELTVGLDYIPAALDTGEITKVYLTATGDSITSAYTGSWGIKEPYCDELGWAFSYDGHEFSNVVYEDRSTTDNPATGGLTYSYSYLYTVTIQEDGLTGAPTSYTVSEVEGDWLWGDRITQLKYPDYNNQGLMSFDWWRVHPTPPYAPGSPDGLYAPVYCYYVDTQLKVIRYTNSYEAKKTSYSTDSIPPINPSPYQNSEPAPTKYGSGEEAINYKNGFETPEYTTQAGSKSSGSYVRWFKSTYCYDAIIIMEETASSDPSHAQGSWSQWYHETKTNHTENAGAPIEVLVIPFNDRESYFLHTSVDSTTSSHLRSLTNGTFFRPVGAQGYIGPCGAGRPYATSTNHNAWSYNGLGIPNVALQEYQYFDNSYSATTFSSYPFPNGAYVWMPEELMNNGLTNEWCMFFQYDTLGSSAADSGQKFCALPWLNYIYVGVVARSPKCGYGESSFAVQYRLTPGGTIFTDNTNLISGPLLDLSHVGGMRGQWLSYYGEFTNQSVAESGQVVYDIIGFVGGTSVTMGTPDANSLTDWTRYIDDPANDQQWMMAVVDNTNSVNDIYTPNMAPDSMSYPSELLGSSSYPYNDVESINACWVGNPVEP